MKNGIDSDEPRICDAVNEGMGCSEANSKRVSAPTMPPIEWPISITWTEGSMVGEGVEFETSMSITLFCSLPSHLISTIAREIGREEKRYHSRNLPTQSFKSPLVSNLGYVTYCTDMFGSACLTSAVSWSGNLRNVSLPPCKPRQLVSALCREGVVDGANPKAVDKDE